MLYSICTQMFYSQMRMKTGLRPQSARPPAAVDQTSAGTHLLLVAGRQRRGNERRRGIAQKIENHEAARKTSSVILAVKQTVEKMHQQCESPHKAVS